ncbi:MAG: hypothetical protein AABY49_03235 [Planctomycetota bacterium]
MSKEEKPFEPKRTPKPAEPKPRTHEKGLPPVDYSPPPPPVKPPKKK